MSRREILPANIQKKRLGVDRHETERLPHIPQATLTGMRTFIRGKTHSAEMIMRTEQTSDDSDSRLASHEENPEEIKIKYLTSEEVKGFPGYPLHAS